MELPNGTVTMLFSDVEGSTRLLAALGDQYGEVLSAQRRLLREAFGRHHGTELFAGIFGLRGDAGRAARMVGTAEALRDQAGMPIRGTDAELLEEYIAAARDSAGPRAWDEQRRIGHGRSADEALADAGAA